MYYFNVKSQDRLFVTCEFTLIADIFPKMFGVSCVFLNSCAFFMNLTLLTKLADLFVLSQIKSLRPNIFIGVLSFPL